jgi:predicted ABC-type ATPase
VAAPFLWLLVGPNGAGKTTYYERVIAPRLRLPFVNADRIARGRWPRNYSRHAYEAARIAEATRYALLYAGKSFVAETVFSHPSKLEFVKRARAAGYTVWITFVGVGSPELAVARVGQRLREGGHPVPPDKVRERYVRLQANVRAAVPLADRLAVVDNSEKGRALRDVLLFEQGRVVRRARDLPEWAATLFSEQLKSQ